MAELDLPLVTEPPGTPLPAPVLGQGLKAAGVPTDPFAGMKPQYDRGMARLDQLGAERELLATKHAKATGDLQTRMGVEAEAGKAIKEPVTGNIPTGFQHQGIRGEDLESLMQTMFAFAAIGGAMTRAPITAALNNFNGAMKGFVQGDSMVFDREKAEFDRNLRAAIAKNQEARQSYQDAFTKHKGNMQDLMNEWTILTKSYGDSVGAINAERQDVNGMLRHIESLAKSEQQAAAADRRLQAMTASMTARLNAQNAANDQRKVLAERRMKLAEDQFNFRKAEALKAQQAKFAKMPEDERKKMDARNDLMEDAKAVKELLAQRPVGVGPETMLGDLAMSYWDEDGIPLRAALARLQANYSFGQGGKALTGTEKAILAPVTEWRGKNASALAKQVDALITAIERGNADLLQRYPPQAAPGAGGAAGKGGKPGVIPPPPDGFVPLE